ncbi:MAG: hypothetical protein H6R02_1108, partial [Burkholderiaceae bacterium]|nr:hypothetical protein [Burkholderiaceae bacterium]
GGDVVLAWAIRYEWLLLFGSILVLAVARGSLSPSVPPTSATRKSYKPGLK